ncbi:hypothetical protein [Methylovorus glucosotrophus]|nr:hypothetical protein [Methylovorus glucosotrophus]
MFNTHAYKAKFKSLMELVQGLKLGDLSQTNNVNEILRLKKVVGYVDETLKSIDPELVPLNIWDPFAQHASNAMNEVANYISSSNIGHIHNANSYVDNILNIIRPYMIVKGKLKTLNENIFSKTKGDIEAYLEEFKERADNIVDQINEELNKSNESSQSITSLESKVMEIKERLIGDDHNDGIVDLITSTHRDVSQKASEVELLYEKLLVDKGKQLSIDTQVSQTLDAVLINKDDIEEIHQSVVDEVKDLREFYIKIFGKLNDSEERSGGLSNEISERLSVLRSLEFSNKIRYEEIVKQIESLLPGATSAGLARAYMQMKRSYENPIIWFTRLFYLAIILLVGSSMVSIFHLSYDAQGWNFGLQSFDTWDAAIKGLINKLPLYGSLIWFAYYVSKRRSEAQRLQQEYAHKEALAKSYASYKKQIDALGSEDAELQKNFIEKMVEAIAYNASATLDGNHGDKHPFQELVDKVGKKLDGMQPSEILEFFKKPGGTS